MELLFLDLSTVRTLLYYGAIYAVVIGFAAWIYQDAKREEIAYPAVWALATLVLTIIPVILYMVVKTRRGGAE